MGKRGDNAFKRTDAVRALESARAGGLVPAMMEVAVASDGTVTFRIYGDNAVQTPTPNSGSDGAAEWAAEIEKLKQAKPKLR